MLLWPHHWLELHIKLSSPIHAWLHQKSPLVFQSTPPVKLWSLPMAQPSCMPSTSTNHQQQTRLTRNTSDKSSMCSYTMQEQWTLPSLLPLAPWHLCKQHQLYTQCPSPVATGLFCNPIQCHGKWHDSHRAQQCILPHQSCCTQSHRKPFLLLWRLWNSTGQEQHSAHCLKDSKDCHVTPEAISSLVAYQLTGHYPHHMHYPQTCCHLSRQSWVRCTLPQCSWTQDPLTHPPWTWPSTSSNSHSHWQHHYRWHCQQHYQRPMLPRHENSIFLAPRWKDTKMLQVLLPTWTRKPQWLSIQTPHGWYSSTCPTVLCTHWQVPYTPPMGP